MEDYYIFWPYSGDENALYRNSRSGKTSYLMSEKHFWHNGIHFYGDDPLKTVFMGTVKAARITNTYNKANDFDILDWYKTERIESAIRTMLSSIPDIDAHLILTTYFEAGRNSGTIKLKGDLTQDQKKTIAEIFHSSHSSNFVMMEYNVIIDPDNVVNFFMLYHHLKPQNYLQFRTKALLPWYDLKIKAVNREYWGVEVFSDSACTRKIKVLPSELKIVPKTTPQSNTAVEIEWTLNGTDGKGYLKKGSLCRDRGGYYEIWRFGNNAMPPANIPLFVKEKGLPIYNSVSSVIRIVDNGKTIDVISKASFIDFDVNVFQEVKDGEVNGFISLKALHGKDNSNRVIAPVENTNDRDTAIRKAQLYENNLGDPVFGVEIKLEPKAGMEFDKVSSCGNMEILANSPLGYPGNYDQQGTRKFSHIELFFENLDFMEKTPPEEYGYYYKVKSDCTGNTLRRHEGQITNVHPLTGQDLPAGSIIKMESGNAWIKEEYIIEKEKFYCVEYIADVETGDIWVEENVNLEDKPKENGYRCNADILGSVVYDFTNNAFQITTRTVSFYKDILYPYGSGEVAERKGTVDGRNYIKLDRVYAKRDFPPNRNIKIRDSDFFKHTNYPNNNDNLNKHPVNNSHRLLFKTEENTPIGTFIDELTSLGIPCSVPLEEGQELLNKYESIKTNETNVIWQKVSRVGNTSDFYVKKSDIDNNFSKISLYNWPLFFSINKDTEGKPFEIKSASDFMVEENAEVADFFSARASIVPIGRIINNSPLASDYLAKIIYKRPSEWKYNQDYLKALVGVNDTTLKHKEVLMKHMCFWDDINTPQQENAGGLKGLWERFKSLFVKKSSGTGLGPSVYYANPIKFISHLKRIIVEKQRMIRHVQDIVMHHMPSYEQDAYGNWPYNIEFPIGQTYCNQAVYTTIRTLDTNWNKFLNGVNGNDAPAERNPAYSGRTSNYWCLVLREAATSGKIIEVAEEETQYLANMGYLVIGSWLNPTRSPHFVTVRPGAEYLPRLGNGGALVAHVGSSPNGERRVSPTSDNPTSAYGNAPRQDIKWFYNKDQQLKLDWIHINKFRWRAR